MIINSLVGVSEFLEKERRLDDRIKNDSKAKRMYNSKEYARWLDEHHPGWVDGDRRKHFEIYELEKGIDEDLLKK